MELKKFRICERMDAHLHMATRNQGSQLARKHLGVATRNDNVGIVLCVPIAETFLKMLNLLNFVDENIIVFIPNKTLFNPRIEVNLGFDVLISLLLLVNIDNIGIWSVLVALDKIFHYIAFANASSSNNSNDIAFPYPRVHNISIILSC